MKTIRSFIAVPLAPNVRAAAVRLVQRMSEPGDGIKWVPTDNLHLTLKFLGEVDNVEVPAVCDSLQKVCDGVEPFELIFGDTGAFPNLDRPRVIWAGIKDSSGMLCKLVADIERRFAELGFKPEPRDYRPHLTLGRTKTGSRRASEPVVRRIRQESGVSLGQMQVDSVQLMASFLDKRGPSYQVMYSLDL